MVKRLEHYHTQEGQIIPEAWFKHMETTRPALEIKLIEQALTLAKIAGEHIPTIMQDTALQQGLVIAELLHQLNLDAESIACALIYPCVRYGEFSLEDVKEQLNSTVAKLIQGVMQMDAMKNLHSQTSVSDQPTQLDNLRKMVLAMVQDVRVVIIKLAERTSWMRQLKVLPPIEQQLIAKETHDIYAPLANRLGIGQLKWELEDLSFRYLNHEIYKDIAKGLDLKRVEREAHIQQILHELTQGIKQLGLKHFQLQGRAKHIFSIYRKMMRKKADLKQIYDVSAVRVLVDTIEECYAVLSLVHQSWQPIPQEFDDYIAQPKPNGYQSLHTAVKNDMGLTFEVQIRTFEMHQTSELGVAAHWVYKEGGANATSSYDQKIAWLRELMNWQKEIGQTEASALETQVFNDRVYVFTPNNEILDLPIGATPLDFAYQVHTNLGHRCRGAKINNTIVTLTYQLKTGDRVEILTAKEPNPSRDWMNPHLGYIQSARTRAKILNWFKKLDFDKHLADGKDVMDKELKRLHLSSPNLEKLVERFNRKTIDELYAGIGSGDVKVGQVIHALEQLNPELQAAKTEVLFSNSTKNQEINKKLSQQIDILGVGNLLTYIAKCCRPVPGDSIIGYITQNRGVAIHRKDCPNILNASNHYQYKMIDVDWGEQKGAYPVEIYIRAHDRQGLIRDVTTLLANEKSNVLNFTTQTDKRQHLAHLNFIIEVVSLENLSKLFDKIRQLSNIILVERKQ